MALEVLLVENLPLASHVLFTYRIWHLKLLLAALVVTAKIGRYKGIHGQKKGRAPNRECSFISSFLNYVPHRLFTKRVLAIQYAQRNH
jgi:hypothetical protein